MQEEFDLLRAQTAQRLTPFDQTKLKLEMAIREKEARPLFSRGVRMAVAASLALATSGALAATLTDWLSIDVDTKGKTNAQVEAEIHQQLSRTGFSEAEVKFEQTEDGHSMLIDGYQGEHRVILLDEKSEETCTEDADRVAVRIPPLILDRPPGMTDEAYYDHLRTQLKNSGVELKIIGDDQTPVVIDEALAAEIAAELGGGVDKDVILQQLQKRVRE